MTLGVRAVVEDEQGKILLVRHSYVKGWYFPGGGVEAGQTLLQALARELHEEVNIGNMGPVELIGIYFNKHASVRDHVALYHCKDWSEMKEFSANREITEIGFFDLENLPDETTKGTRARLAEIYQGREKSEVWQ